MESAGARWWPTAGAVYYLTAIKRVRMIFYSYDDFLKKYKYIIDNAMNIANH